MPDHLETGKLPDARTRLSAVALELFARHGYSATSVRMLCEKADVSVGIINYHWGSKEGLWVAVVQYCSDRIQTIVKQCAESNDLLSIEGAHGFFGALFDALADEPEVMRIMMWTTLEAGSVNYADTFATFQPIIAFGASFVRHWQAEGRALPVDVELSLLSVREIIIYSTVDRYFQRELFGEGMENPAFRARLREHFIRVALGILGVRLPPAAR